MASLSKDQVVGIIKAAPAGVRPEDVVTELVKAGHVLEGYGAPATDFKTAHATEMAKRAEAQKQPPAGLGGVAKGALQTSSDMAFAAPKIAKAGVQAGAQALREAAPSSNVAAGAAAATDFASNVIPTTPGELAAQAVGERYAGPAIKAVGKAANPVAKKALGFMAEKFGGLSREVTTILEKRAPDVMRYARQGVEAAEESAAAAAKAVKAHIDDYAAKAGERYRAASDAIIATNPQLNTLRIDLARMTGDAVQGIRNEFGFPDQSARLPNRQIVDPSGRAVAAAQGAISRVGKADADTELFNSFAAMFKNSLTPAQAYYLQLDLQQAAAANVGKPIAKALQALKREVISASDGTFTGTALADMNKDYRGAMTLVDDLSKVANADNAVSVINSAFRNRSETRDALQAIAASSPQVQKSLDDLFAATAGKQVAHWTAQLPPTGAKALYQVGLGASGAAVVANPALGIPSGAAYMAATSPRVYGEAFNALSKTMPKLPKGSSTAALAALRARRKEER